MSLIFPVCSAQELPVPVPVSEAYVWKNVKIGGGGFVSGLQFQGQVPGLLYARTDVGGAYRWEEQAGRWEAMTDFLGMEDVNLTGIESLAVDPTDADRVYLAAGTYTAPHVGKGAIFRSKDRGRSFERTDMPFRMGANEAGRGNGERLVVDPRRGAVLMLGTRAEGLWRSEDFGATWRELGGFPALAKGGQTDTEGSRMPQRVGVNIVLLDPRSGVEGRGCRVVYACISTRQAEALWRSEDFGETWAPVAGQPQGLRPTRAVLTKEGILYLTFGDEPGPNTMARGAVWRLDTGRGEWRDITPLDPAKSASGGFGYGAVTVDASNPARLLVSTFCRYQPEHDELFLSSDAGRSWRPVFEASDFDHSQSPWAAGHTPHWMADVRIDPKDPEHALFVTGYGVYRTRNLGALERGGRVRWVFDNEGLEETVPLGLASPPEGPHLLSALGDIDGFRHDNLDTAMETYPPTPRFANSESIAFAALRPALVVRSGNVRGRTTQVRIAWSADGGRSWAAMPTEPAGGRGAGVVDVSADGTVIAWTPRGEPPEGATGSALWRPWPGEPAVTRDRGRSWERPEGLPRGVSLVADKVNPRRWYALDAERGIQYLSTDGARSFSPAATGLPAATPLAGGFGGGGGHGGILHAVPGAEGELWLETRSEGLRVSRDGGRNYVKVPGVEAAYSLGFGRAAPGRGHPSLYLAGRVSKKSGLFRSDDEGATWVEIDDPRHRFGWINHVTGDPRVHGRVYFATGGRGIIYGEPVGKE